MYIMKRPSGGRGEYEVAKEYRGIGPHDLLDKEIYLEVAGRVRPTGVTVREQGGKPRLRKLPASRALHLHRQVEAMALMPKSRRQERGLPAGMPVVMQDRYILRRIDVRSAALEDDRAILSLGNLTAVNDSDEIKIGLTKRLQRVAAVHDRADELGAPFSSLLHEHMGLIQSAAALPPRAEAVVEDLMVALAESQDFDIAYAAGMDPLEALEELAGLAPSSASDQDIVPIEEIPATLPEIRRRVLRRLQTMRATRGAASMRFSTQVRRAYRSTCFVCGLTLPKTQFCNSGVDAAHILPWAKYDLDVTANGLCLCKLHHWAFDEQLIAVLVEDGAYRVALTPRGRRALQGQPEALESFRQVEGPVPADRLPRHQSDWPAPEFLARLYEAFPPAES